MPSSPSSPRRRLLSPSSTPRRPPLSLSRSARIRRPSHPPRAPRRAPGQARRRPPSRRRGGSASSPLRWRLLSLYSVDAPNLAPAAQGRLGLGNQEMWPWACSSTASSITTTAVPGTHGAPPLLRQGAGMATVVTARRRWDGGSSEHVLDFVGRSSVSTRSPLRVLQRHPPRRKPDPVSQPSPRPGAAAGGLSRHRLRRHRGQPSRRSPPPPRLRSLSRDTSSWLLPSYGRGHELPGKRYKSLITGESGTIDGQGVLCDIA